MEKYVYIKKSIAGHFVDFPEALDGNLYDNIGATWEDYLDNKWVLLNAGQVGYLASHPGADVKEVWDMGSAPRTVEQAKSEMLRRINDYDRSDEVNGFTINGVVNGWFTPSERSNYKSSIDAAKLLGIDALSIVIGGSPFSIPTDMAEQMLARIQLYADQCYIVTQQHKAAVNALGTVMDVDSYDYRDGYPGKLDFSM